MEALAEAIARLAAQGFRHDFRAIRYGLVAVDTGDTYAPEAIGVEEVVRFEGSTAPDYAEMIRRPAGRSSGPRSGVGEPTA